MLSVDPEYKPPLDLAAGTARGPDEAVTSYPSSPVDH